MQLGTPTNDADLYPGRLERRCELCSGQGYQLHLYKEDKDEITLKREIMLHGGVHTWMWRCVAVEDDNVARRG